MNELDELKLKLPKIEPPELPDTTSENDDKGTNEIL